MIPKPDGGGERALGIPTIRDRVAQTAAKLVLEPIFEADFRGQCRDVVGACRGGV
jgi:RNA-directed DNA polymerase